MFFVYESGITEIPFEQAQERGPVFGIIGAQELKNIGEKLGFSQAAVEACMTESTLFRTDIEVHDIYTFSEIRIISETGKEDCIALFIKENLMLVVCVSACAENMLSKLSAVLRRFPANKINTARVACSFIESLVSGGNKNIELLRNEITEMEESVINGDVDRDFNVSLLELKKQLLRLHNYYGQLLDIAEALEENENDIFDESQLIYATNLINKITHLREDVDSLRNESDHLQDAYSATLDMKLNNSMKIFTVITTIFFPLTIIVGWYGMNFTAMPELTWKYGYIFVIALSVLTVLGLTLLGKKKKWF